jgi:hypothetical protein
MSKTARAKSSSALIVRLVVFGTLAVLLVLAFLDYRAKQAFTKTTEAFRDAIQQQVKGDVLKSQLKPLIQGSPTIASVDPKSTKELELAASGERYVWKGILRNYTLLLGYGPGDDPPVEIVAPADAAE